MRKLRFEAVLSSTPPRIMEKLSIIIPAYNEENYLPHCLDSLSRWVVGDERLSEVVVVDNASTDGTVGVATRYPFVRVVREDVKGTTRARQRGLLSTQGELLAFLDADTRIGEGWLDRIFQHFADDHFLVCVSGPAYFFDTTPKQDRAVHLYWSYVVRPTSKVTGFMVVGGNFAVRRSAMEQIGGFDTTIPFYGDDANLARRLREVGRVVFDNNFRVYSSGRRLRGEGMLKVGAVYVANYLSEAVFKHPITRRYNDIR